MEDLKSSLEELCCCYYYYNVERKALEPLINWTIMKPATEH